ncbi:GntR family transcriptional regulator [Saccharothrix violaceirubra]|uniref:GntR family transcriptional regulator n=1 Tax=Saccharothrix violaceirubra TaxID=413306 RepID=A0A7W7WT52_9PSEU|nr:GntR family transcriptional regulator [Saccharothrix violaceirubra]MBB4962840.1 GntR family transcriptional regulator [Saccharothrix violaceirubra]
MAARSDRYGYREIADALRARIDSDGPDRLGPGDRVPGENEITAEYGVEQPTARRALDLLKNEGLIVARRGSGTYVRDFKRIRRVTPDRLRSSVWGGGESIWGTDVSQRPYVSEPTVAAERPVTPIADALGLTADGLAVVRRRRYLVEGKPVQLATSYYPEHLVKDSAITREDTGEGGAYARLAELGHPPVRFREELRARMPREEERVDLELAQGTPVVEIVRYAHAADDVPVEVTVMVLDGASYVLEYKFDSQG